MTDALLPRPEHTSTFGLRTVGCFVHSLPDGYDTVLGDEGDTVSAGETQLLSVARAFLVGPFAPAVDEVDAT